MVLLLGGGIAAVLILLWGTQWSLGMVYGRKEVMALHTYAYGTIQSSALGDALLVLVYAGEGCLLPQPCSYII